MFKVYLSLTKPGIIVGNIITASAGFFLASKGHYDFGILLAMLIGLSLVIASACVFNNFIDRGIDELMERTKNRALVKKLIPGHIAIIYGAVLGIIGFLVLATFTNFLTVLVAFIGFFFYIVMYGIGKRRSDFGVVIGSISGAVPPVVGYCAVSNNLDLEAIILFLILVLWQMPHFYAISIFRMKEYAAAGIPVLPIKKGIFTTKFHIFLYIIGFIIATISLTVFGYTGYIYLTIVTLLGAGWLFYAIKGFNTTNDILWARKMFRYSLIIIMVFSILVSVDVVKPII